MAFSIHTSFLFLTGHYRVQTQAGAPSANLNLCVLFVPYISWTLGMDHIAQSRSISLVYSALCKGTWTEFHRPISIYAQDKISRIWKHKHSGNTGDRCGNPEANTCFRQRIYYSFSCFRRCVFNGTGTLFSTLPTDFRFRNHVLFPQSLSSE